MMEGTICRRAAYRALRSTIYRTVYYRLPATQFSPSQCTEINFRLHRNMLSRMGFKRCLPNAYRYAPTCYNGLGLMDTRLEQCTMHIMEYILHTGKSTLSGNALQAEVELCHIHCGLGSNLFQQNYATYCYLLPECELKFVLRESSFIT